MATSAGLALTLSACGDDGAESAGPATAEEQSTTTEISPSTTPTASAETSAEVPAANTDATEYFVDGVLERDDVTIRITDVRKIAVGEPGNEHGDTPVIAFFYDITNKSDEGVTANSKWIFAFDAVQDNDPNIVNKLDVAGHPDPATQDTQSAEIKPGGTISNAVAYELTDETTPVELIADDDLGTQTFPIQ
ncbi:hypothetical protein GCM10010980_12550 [Corynebacterium marinum]|nr:hypothetical protein GCM10010980_12550 [Corynebacterium marinum]